MRTEAYIFIAVTSLGGVTTTHSWSRIQTLAVLTLLDNDTFRGMIFNSYLCYFFFISSPEQKLRMSYCHHPMSVVRRRPSSVVRRQQLVC